MTGDRRVLTYEAGVLAPRPDALSVEEPLEIRLNGEAVSITMRTPGHDAELAVGFLHGEGLLSGPEAIAHVGPGRDPCPLPGRHGAPAANVIALETRDPVDASRLKRHFYATSSCGVCGKNSLKALQTQAPPVESAMRLPVDRLLAMPEALRAAQATFARTGSLHATALFDAEGTLLAAFEDVGRHNAVDKAVGHCLLRGLPLDHAVMLVSGRTSFEILQKAVMARIPIVAAISGPSSLAVELAEAFGVTLVGFLRGDRFNVYSHPERLVTSPPG